VPNFWVRIDLSPPTQRRDDVREIVKRWGGKLREDQLYIQIGRPGTGYVLIKGPDDPAAYNRMLDELGGPALQLLDVDEAQASFDLTPPPQEPDSEA
jgi:hypothetical protein